LPRSMPMDAMFMDDPPHINCRAKSYSAADHLINPLPAPLFEVNVMA
jgi:hypothetical protein